MLAETFISDVRLEGARIAFTIGACDQRTYQLFQIF
jgi:hypothetical protein